MIPGRNSPLAIRPTVQRPSVQTRVTNPKRLAALAPYSRATFFARGVACPLVSRSFHVCSQQLRPTPPLVRSISLSPRTRKTRWQHHIPARKAPRVSRRVPSLPLYTYLSRHANAITRNLSLPTTSILTDSHSVRLKNIQKHSLSIFFMWRLNSQP